MFHTSFSRKLRTSKLNITREKAKRKLDKVAVENLKILIFTTL